MRRKNHSDGILCNLEGVNVPPLEEDIGLFNANLLEYIGEKMSRAVRRCVVMARSDGQANETHLIVRRDREAKNPSYKKLSEVLNGSELLGGVTVRVIGRESMQN